MKNDCRQAWWHMPIISALGRKKIDHPTVITMDTQLLIHKPSIFGRVIYLFSRSQA